MKKYISFGGCNKKYAYIFLSIFFVLLNKAFRGFSFDGDEELIIKIIDNGKFKYHLFIRQIFEYLFCIIVASALILKDKIGQNRDFTQQNEENNEILLKPSLTLVSDLTMIYKETFESTETNYPKLLIFKTFFLYIVLEQIKIIFKLFFIHMDFWMFQLFIVAFLNKKIFKIEIYKHQIIAFVFIVVSFILNFITVLLTMSGGQEYKALYISYHWLVFLALVIYLLYSFFLSYTFINIKKLMDLKFISFNKIMLIYGVFGFFFCILFCLITTFSSSNTNNKITNYIFQVTDQNNNTFIDNFKIYFLNFRNNNDVKNEDKNSEIALIFLRSLSFALYKLYTFKVIEDLTVLHKILCYPLLYFFQKILLLFIKGYKIKGDLIGKFIIDIFSDFLSVIGYLIYIEIIEINICNLNYNLRKNIMARSRSEPEMIIDAFGDSEGDDVPSDNSKETKSSKNLEVYN